MTHFLITSKDGKITRRLDTVKCHSSLSIERRDNASSLTQRNQFTTLPAWYPKTESVTLLKNPPHPLSKRLYLTRGQAINQTQ